MRGATGTSRSSGLRCPPPLRLRARQLFPGGGVRQPHPDCAPGGARSPTRLLGRSGSAREVAGPPEAIFELSSKQNVFHFVLDGFQSDVFLDIIEAERAEMDRHFSGFTFFANHAGAFPTTIVSIPAMHTGQVYRNKESMRRFMSAEFKDASIFSAMRGQGYQVDAVSGLIFDKASATNYYRLPTPYVSYDAYVRFTAWQLADLSLFRHSPHLVKPTIYNDQNWRLQNTVRTRVGAHGSATSSTGQRRGVPQGLHGRGCASHTTDRYTSTCTSAFRTGR